MAMPMEASRGYRHGAGGLFLGHTKTRNSTSGTCSSTMSGGRSSMDACSDAAANSSFAGSTVSGLTSMDSCANVTANISSITNNNCSSSSSCSGTSALSTFEIVLPDTTVVLIQAASLTVSQVLKNFPDHILSLSAVRPLRLPDDTVLFRWNTYYMHQNDGGRTITVDTQHERKSLRALHRQKALDAHFNSSLPQTARRRRGQRRQEQLSAAATAAVAATMAAVAATPAAVAAAADAASATAAAVSSVSGGVSDEAPAPDGASLTQTKKGKEDGNWLKGGYMDGMGRVQGGYREVQKQRSMRRLSQEHRRRCINRISQEIERLEEEEAAKQGKGQGPTPAMGEGRRERRKSGASPPGNPETLAASPRPAAKGPPAKLWSKTDGDLVNVSHRVEGMDVSPRTNEGAPPRSPRVKAAGQAASPRSRAEGHLPSPKPRLAPPSFGPQNMAVRYPHSISTGAVLSNGRTSQRPPRDKKDPSLLSSAASFQETYFPVKSRPLPPSRMSNSKKSLARNEESGNLAMSILATQPWLKSVFPEASKGALKAAALKKIFAPRPTHGPGSRLVRSVSCNRAETEGLALPAPGGGQTLGHSLGQSLVRREKVLVEQHMSNPVPARFKAGLRTALAGLKARGPQQQMHETWNSRPVGISCIDLRHLNH